jgi:uncharacterized membrane protein
MSTKQRGAKPPVKKPTSNAVEAAFPEHPEQQFKIATPFQQQTTQVFHGPTPPPDVMERYEALVPGIAKRLFDLAEDESTHRRALETSANEANIAAQQRQLAIAEKQADGVFRSDALGQGAGLIVALSCIAGAVYLAVNNHEGVAVALAAIPTAAVIQAFFAKRVSKDASNSAK